MKTCKRFGALLLALVLTLSLSVTAFAAVEDTGFSDVDADDWFADSAVYVRDNGIMNGTSATTFNPDGTTSRGQIAAILYRAAGSPAVSAAADFPDVAEGAYYADAASWAAANGIVTGLCGGSQFWVPGGEKVLPTNTCPLIKASVGARLDRTCPFFRIADMYVGETTCDGKKKAWEILAEDVPVHVMDLPQMKREKDVCSWADEIRTFKKVVEDFTGNEITAEKLAASIHMINNKRKALERLYAFRKNDKLPISGKDVLLISQIAFYDDPTRFTEMTNKLCDELEQRVADGISVFPEGTKRIMLTGTPLAIPNWKIHNLVETSGGAVVCEEMCTGTRYFERLVDETKTTVDEQIDALAERYMGINCACFTPNHGRIDDIIRLAKEYKVDGVIDVNLKFCSLYDVEGYTVERELQKAGIPVLGIETDYVDSDAQQLRTRISAFIEMLGA